MTRRPFFPTSADDPEAQRLLNAARELVSLALAREVDSVPPVSLPSGSITALSFGVLNRVRPPYDGVAVLPAMRPENVNVPLYVSKTAGTGTMRLRSIESNLNASATGISQTAAGLRVLINDGSAWWST